MKNKTIIGVVLTLVLIILSAGELFAGEVMKQRVDPTKEIGIFYGEIEDGDAEKLEQFLSDNPDITDLALVSPGGSSYEGYRLGAVISNHKLDVWILPGAGCVSACATAFLGGATYHIYGTLAFHVAYIRGGPSIEGVTPSAFLKAGQLEGVRNMAYTLQNGFSAQLVYLITATTNEDRFIVFHTTEDLMRFYVRDDTEGGSDGFQAYFEPILQPSEFVVWLEEHTKSGEEIYNYMIAQRREDYTNE